MFYQIFSKKITVLNSSNIPGMMELYETIQLRGRRLDGFISVDQFFIEKDLIST